MSTPPQNQTHTHTHTHTHTQNTKAKPKQQAETMCLESFLSTGTKGPIAMNQKLEACRLASAETQPQDFGW